MDAGQCGHYIEGTFGRTRCVYRAEYRIWPEGTTAAPRDRCADHLADCVDRETERNQARVVVSYIGER